MFVLRPHPRGLDIGEETVFHPDFAALDKLHITLGCLLGRCKVPAILTEREPHILFERPLRAVCALASAHAIHQRL